MEISGQLHAVFRVIHEKTSSGNLCVGGWLGFRASLDIVEEREISWLCGESKSQLFGHALGKRKIKRNEAR
jgi:hypothetical protein